MYLLKLALRPWRIALLSQVFSALAVGFLILLAGFLFWMERSLRPVVNRLQSEQVITAYLDSTVEAKDEEKIFDSIKVALGSQAARANELKLVPAQQFIQELREHYADLSNELVNIGEDMNSMIPRYVGTVDQVRAVPGVEAAETSVDRYKHIVGAFSALRWVAKLLAAGLCLALFTGLIHLSRMNAYLHKDALSLLRFWGAGGWILRVPAVLSSFGVGFLGGVLAFGGWVTGGLWLAKHLHTLSPILKDMPLPSVQMGLMLLVAGSVIGLLAGTLAGGGVSAK
jgi:cell division protein FtsX